MGDKTNCLSKLRIFPPVVIRWPVRIVIAVLMTIVGLHETAYSRWPYAVPDFSSNDTWSDNHIASAEIIAVKQVPTLRGEEIGTGGQIVMKVIRAYTLDGLPFADDSQTTLTIPRGATIYPAFSKHEQPIPKAGERLVFVTAKDHRSAILCLQPGTRGIDAKIIEYLEAIAELRNKGDRQEDLIAAVFETNTILVKYAMRELLRNDVESKSEVLRNRVASLRDDVTTATDTAVLASQLNSRLSGEQEYNDNEYKWLKNRLSSQQDPGVSSARLLLRRIAKYSQRRSETIAFLNSLARKSSWATPSQKAILDAMVSDDLFSYRNPDQHSAIVFSLMTDMLDVDSAEAKLAAVNALNQIAFKAANLRDCSKGGCEYLEKSKQALHDGAAHEKDEGVRKAMRFTLQILDRELVVPQSGEQNK